MFDDWSELLAKIHNSRRQVVLAVTGGASYAIGALLVRPGASRSILEARVPYAYSALVEWLGGEPDQACSDATARAMAAAAWTRARDLAPDSDPKLLVGIGATCSLASDRPKRGEHRVFVAFQTYERTASFKLTFGDKTLSRTVEETIAAYVVLLAAADACGIDVAAAREIVDASIAELPIEPQLETPSVTVPPYMQELWLGVRSIVVMGPESEAVRISQPTIVFPGAFNPPHEAHLKMAAIAEALLGGKVSWELSITNVDKPPLDFLSIIARGASLHMLAPERPILLTRASTFEKKAALFPGATFVVGADTISRIAAPRYYGDSDSRRDEAIATIAAHGCRFLVFGRQTASDFQTLGDVELPATLAQICTEVPPTEFREDVSSTAIRSSSSG